jgi:hypothetical protein
VASRREVVVEMWSNITAAIAREVIGTSSLPEAWPVVLVLPQAVAPTIATSPRASATLLRRAIDPSPR